MPVSGNDVSTWLDGLKARLNKLEKRPVVRSKIEKRVGLRHI
jgi:hypothetical protein